MTAGTIEKEIINADVMEGLKTLKDESIDCCVTSPPYWGLRDYGTAKWEGGDENCSHKRDSKISASGETGSDNISGGVGDAIYKDLCPKCGAKRIDAQIGLEKTPEEYVNKLVEVFREVKRVLKKEGTLWLNLGDTYHGGGGGNYGTGLSVASEHGQHLTNVRNRIDLSGLKPKDLVGIPWRVAFALQADGWYLRQDIIWSKPNPMPESVRDRCTKAHEYIFMLTKSARYWYDAEAIKESTTTKDNSNRDRDSSKLNNTPGRTRMAGLKTNNYELRNRRSVWTITTKPFKEAHFATFPEDLVNPMIKAGCPENGTVLDPFAGAGTTGLVALKLNRKPILIELNPKYCEMMRKKLKPYLEQRILMGVLA